MTYYTQEVAVTQIHIIRTKNKVPKQRDLISATLCMDSAGYKIETMQCFIIVYMHAERVCKSSPEVLISCLPACFCQLCCDQKLRYDWSGLIGIRVYTNSGAGQ